MDEEDVASKKLEPVSNGKGDVEEKVNVDEKADVDKKAQVEQKAEVEEKTEAVMDEKGEQHDGVTEKEEDKTNDGSDSQQMDVDKVEDKESKEIEEKVAKKGEEVVEETEADNEKQGTAVEDGGKEQLKSEDMEEESVEKTKAGSEDKDEEEADGVKEKDKLEEPKEEKNSKKRPRSKSSAGRMDKSRKKEMVEEEKEQKAPTEKKKKEPKTPTVPTIERPVRERKSVERLVAFIEKDASKEFHIEKGRGMALKDIPNVAYKLSRKKTEDTFKLLHTILFGRRGKAAQVKNNISRFSGLVWHDNEEKQMIKVKEKLDKCVKEKLVEFSDVLDIPISKANTRKEDIIAKLIEFLVEPHATTSDLLVEKEQGKKRKRISKSASESSTQSKGSAKSRKKPGGAYKKDGETKSTPPGSEDESEEGKEKEINGVPEKSDDEMSEQNENEDKRSESEEELEEKGKQKRGSAKSSAKKGFSEKTKTKKVTISKKTSPPPKKRPAKSQPRPLKNNNDTSAKKSSGKNREDPMKKSSTSKKSSLKENTDSLASVKKVLKVKEKPEETVRPSDEELRIAICEILKEVDFNTATFTDILKLLVKQFDEELMQRKSTIKLMIQDELTKLAEVDDDEDEVDAKKDEKNPSGVDVKA